MIYNDDMKRASTTIRVRQLFLKKGKAFIFAWTCALVSVLASVLALAIAVHGAVTSGNFQTIMSHQTLTPFITVAFAVIGALVASHRPRNPIGWIFTTIGLLNGLGALAAAENVFGSPLSPVHPWAAWLDNWLWIPVLILPVFFVPQIFPDGKLLSSRWRLVAWSTALGLSLTVLTAVMQPGPLASLMAALLPTGFPAILAALNDVTFFAEGFLVLGFFGSIAGLFVRFHRSSGIEREQVKWLVYAVGIMFFLMIVITILGLLWPGNRFVNELIVFLTTLAVLGIAVAAAIAILRHRLYDINLIINRTLVYTALTAGVAALYGLVVGSLGALFEAKSNLLVSLLATGLAAILVQPMRDRLQRLVNRLMYGERDDPYAILSRLNDQLEGSNSPEATLPAVVETLAHALKLPYIAIALKQDGRFNVSASYGLAGEGLVQLPLIYQGETVGQLRLSTRSLGEAFTPGEQRLLGDIARHIGVTAHAVLLTQELRQLTADLQRSREELVKSREEERRRLRRDLHDELGPQLASLKLNLDVTRNLISRDPRAAEMLLVELTTQCQAAIADIRQLVFDLRPPALDELGLVGAVHEYTRQIISQDGLQIRLDSQKDLPPLPAAVEVAAYRITLEALANFVRHSQGSACQVSISQSDGRLQVEVCDNGLGLPEQVHSGVGLSSMRERAAELSGTCVIESLPQGGTRVLARLPLG